MKKHVETAKIISERLTDWHFNFLSAIKGQRQVKYFRTSRYIRCNLLLYQNHLLYTISVSIARPLSCIIVDFNRS